MTGRVWLVHELGTDGIHDTRADTHNHWPWEHDTPKECAVSCSRWVDHGRERGRLTVKGTDHDRVRLVFFEKRAELLANPAIAAQEDISQ